MKSLLPAIFLFYCCGCTESFSPELQYIDKDKPHLVPKKIAEGFISKDSIAEYGSVFNEEGDEFYYGVDLKTRSEIRYTCFMNGQWTEPISMIRDSVFSFNDPFLSPDETKLYFISDMPRNDQDTIDDFDIWYSEIREDNWSPPINAGKTVNSDANEYYISFTKRGHHYFASNRDAAKNRKHDYDIYVAGYDTTVNTSAVRFSDKINTKWYETDVFVPQDMSYMIFCSWRKTGKGKGDLYINFSDGHGGWGKTVMFGPEINTEENDLCPFVTVDGKYLFYTSNQDIYWVSTDVLIPYKKLSLKN